MDVNADAPSTLAPAEVSLVRGGPFCRAQLMVGPMRPDHWNLKRRMAGVSQDGQVAVALVLSTPPRIALPPIDTGESRELPVAELQQIVHVSWFPDGKRLLVAGAVAGESLRTYLWSLDGGKPEPLGPADFKGASVSMTGRELQEERRSVKPQSLTARRTRYCRYPASGGRKRSKNGPKTQRPC